MKQTWFKRTGWFYLPIHAKGILFTLGTIAFLVAICMVKLERSDSVSGNMDQICIYTTCTAFWWHWIADKTSEK